MMAILDSFQHVLLMMAPWLIVGFLIAGMVGVLMPREWAEKAMGKSKGWRGVLNAVLIGVPLPVCSCGVLPLTQALRKSGASKGAAAGFLISTPQTGIDSILATYSLMGPLFAIMRPLAAFLTGIVGGAIVNLMTKDEKEPSSLAATPSQSEKKSCCCCCCHGKEERTSNFIVASLRKSWELFSEVVRPLFIGLIIAAIVTAFVPENFFAEAFGGNDFLAMPAMILIGFPMYVCSTASIPIAASMIAKGLTPGAAFVFLMVGPAINAASITTVAQLIGRKAALAYALVISLGAILMGVVVNVIV